MDKKQIARANAVAEFPYWIQRLVALAALVLIFFPQFNAANVCAKVNENLSLFTSAVSWNDLIMKGRALLNMQGGVGQIWAQPFIWLMVGSIITLVGIILCTGGACMSFGNNPMKRKGGLLSLAGGVVMIGGLLTIREMGYYGFYNAALAVNNGDAAKAMERVTGSDFALAVPDAWWIYFGIAVALLVLAALNLILESRRPYEKEMFMPTKYKLFLIMLPFLLLCFIFSYLPLLGWRYAFYDTSATTKLSADNFKGFKYFSMLISDAATRRDVLNVIRNTLVMSGLGIVTSWVPLAFAIFLNEIKTKWFKRVVQVFTTIPNFVSWVLVYALATAIFSTDGFVNSLTGGSVQYLQNETALTWFQMLAWGMWKSVGWSAIIYIAGISGIAPELYEAATVDGAGRGQKMWHITVPGLLPTYFVLLLMSIGNILSNGMDQYYVFETAKNAKYIKVLDLYVYQLGLGQNQIALSTVVSMTKSLISLVLLFTANGVSKAIRGESIM